MNFEYHFWLEVSVGDDGGGIATYAYKLDPTRTYYLQLFLTDYESSGDTWSFAYTYIMMVCERVPELPWDVCSYVKPEGTVAGLVISNKELVVIALYAGAGKGPQGYRAEGLLFSW